MYESNEVCSLGCNTDKISPKWVLKVKSSIRPFITYSWHIFTMCVVTFYLLGKVKSYDKDIVLEVLYIEAIIIVFWFGERIARNIGIADLLKNIGYNKSKVNEQE